LSIGQILLNSLLKTSLFFCFPPGFIIYSLKYFDVSILLCRLYFKGNIQFINEGYMSTLLAGSWQFITLN